MSIDKYARILYNFNISILFKGISAPINTGGQTLIRKCIDWKGFPLPELPDPVYGI